MRSDAYRTICAFGIEEKIRMRNCRGCIYLGTAGSHGCCNYYEMAQRRRPCKFGLKDCPAKVMIPGYVIPKEHIEFCQKIDEMNRRQAEQAERMARIRLERIERLNAEIERQAKEDALGESEPPQKRDPRGRQASWDTHYAFQLYKEGYYMFEIAEVCGTNVEKIVACAKHNEWSKYLPAEVERFRHDMDQAKADYEEYQRRKKEAEQAVEAAWSGKPQNAEGMAER